MRIPDLHSMERFLGRHCGSLFLLPRTSHQRIGRLLCHLYQIKLQAVQLFSRQILCCQYDGDIFTGLQHPGTDARQHELLWQGKGFRSLHIFLMQASGKLLRIWIEKHSEWKRLSLSIFFSARTIELVCTITHCFVYIIGCVLPHPSDRSDHVFQLPSCSCDSLLQTHGDHQESVDHYYEGADSKKSNRGPGINILSDLKPVLC